MDQVENVPPKQPQVRSAQSNRKSNSGIGQRKVVFWLQ
jgi:hypothetical protein